MHPLISKAMARVAIAMISFLFIYFVFLDIFKYSKKLLLGWGMLFEIMNTGL